MTSFLLRGGTVLPMEGSKVVFDPGSVLVIDGKIELVGSVVEADEHPAAANVDTIDATGHAVVPGLHNCHLHSGLLRGTAESLALWEWLEDHIDPAHRALTP
ncbi:MAG: amidohydrolase, partial [Acidimicrobiia bacterium]|nr:amidohydrolase [Acidimicrobiia bacterium]